MKLALLSDATRDHGRSQRDPFSFEVRQGAMNGSTIMDTDLRQTHFGAAWRTPRCRRELTEPFGEREITSPVGGRHHAQSVESTKGGGAS
jgi:hypothetical protein